MYTNADNLINKMEELATLVKLERPDIIGITETLPKHQINKTIIEQLFIPGYELYTSNPENYNGRGVVIYVNKAIISSEIVIMDNIIESIWCQIKLKGNDKLIVGCIYRSPNSPTEAYENIGRMFKKMKDLRSSHLLIIGDFNYKEINWSEKTTSVGENHPATLFLEITRDHYLFQHVDKATRMRGNDTPHLLDLVMTNEENMIDQISYQPGLGKSDHLVLQFCLECYTTESHSTHSKYNYFNADYEAVNEKIRSIDWDMQLEGKSTEVMWDCFAENLNSIVEENIPVCKTKPDNRPTTPWMNRPAIESLRHKRTAWQRYTHCKTDENFEKYIAARNKATAITREAKYTYERNIADNVKENSKGFWKYVRTKAKTKVTIDELEDETGSLTSDSAEKAKILNSFFISVFTNENVENLPNFNDQYHGNPLNSIEINEETVKKLANKLKPEKSQGPDGINPKFIKETIDNISKPLTKIFQKSIEENSVPNDWRKANISAIHKKGSKKKAENYRPISLTSIICKMMERAIRDEIVQHMEENNLFSVHQHGFRKGHSCVTQLIEVLDQWTEAIDQSDSIDVIFLDFKKAFDTVPHKRLLLKLKGYKIEGQIIKWIEKFLENRKQRVVINGEPSEWTNVLSGIPQGSVLGPVLFLIYINDLPNVVENVVKLFADDTKVFTRANSEENKTSLQNDLDRLSKWSMDWQLLFNASKCKVMHIGNQESNNLYYMTEGDERIEICKVQEEKDLGIIIDNKLKFTKHINESVKKSNRVLGLIQRTFSYIDKPMFLQLYKTLVRPHLEYGSQAWSVIYKKECITLENVQRRATKILRNISEKSYSERLKDLGIPSLEYRRVRADMVETYKIINNIDQVNKEKITPILQSRTRGHNYKIYKRQVRLNVRKCSFSQRIVNDWNSLPNEVVSADSLNQFKSRLNKAWKTKDIKFAPSCYS
ncbi:MAG: reverse transcriptase domain-containing protein [Sedimenticola sp.]